MAVPPHFATVWPCIALAALLATPLPASAQWVAVGRWGSEQNFRFVAPGNWMVLSDTAGVEISAEGENHVGRLTFWCRPGMPQGGLSFTHYYGDALRQTLRDPATVESEAVTLVMDGQRFEASLDLIEWERTWVGHDVLGRDLLDAFGRANRLEIQNAAGETVTSFRMNGSTAAFWALRRGCGI